jgi:delta24(24(1))-sterol reductase
VADWIMSFTWGLVVGTASPIPYFYSIFFITVLVHRTTRDFERCVFITFLRLNVIC